jgi:hypothetical protein
MIYSKFKFSRPDPKDWPVDVFRLVSGLVRKEVAVIRKEDNERVEGVAAKVAEGAAVSATGQLVPASRRQRRLTSQQSNEYLKHTKMPAVLFIRDILDPCH